VASIDLGFASISTSWLGKIWFHWLQLIRWRTPEDSESSSGAASPFISTWMMQMRAANRPICWHPGRSRSTRPVIGVRKRDGAAGSTNGARSLDSGREAQTARSVGLAASDRGGLEMRRSRYVPSNEVRSALNELFDDPAVVVSLLGADSSPADTWMEEALSPDVDPRARALGLRAKLEEYIVQIAKEKLELGSEEETRRLRAEGTGLVIALRELGRHFPEL
jgi:hypothetical protein